MPKQCGGPGVALVLVTICSLLFCECWALRERCWCQPDVMGGSGCTCANLECRAAQTNTPVTSECYAANQVLHGLLRQLRCKRNPVLCSTATCHHLTAMPNRSPTRPSRAAANRLKTVDSMLPLPNQPMQPCALPLSQPMMTKRAPIMSTHAQHAISQSDLVCVLYEHTGPAAGATPAAPTPKTPCPYAHTPHHKGVAAAVEHTQNATAGLAPHCCCRHCC